MYVCKHLQRNFEFIPILNIKKESNKHTHISLCNFRNFKQILITSIIWIQWSGESGTSLYMVLQKWLLSENDVDKHASSEIHSPNLFISLTFSEPVPYCFWNLFCSISYINTERHISREMCVHRNINYLYFQLWQQAVINCRGNLCIHVLNFTIGMHFNAHKTLECKYSKNYL